jgi:hypothetical protein
MNDSSDIESELKKLRPAPVRANLVTRIENALLEESSLPTAAVLAQKRSTLSNRQRITQIWRQRSLRLTSAPPPSIPVA